MDEAGFEEATGVGVVVTQEQIDAAVDEHFEKHKSEIEAK